MTEKIDIMYDMLKENREDVKRLIKLHGECAKRSELDKVQKILTTYRGYFLGVCGVCGLMFTVALKMVM